MNEVEVALQGNDRSSVPVLYMALELGKARWLVGFEHEGKRRRVSVEGGEVTKLWQALTQAKAKFGLKGPVRVCSCYEAGRDGFWLHRLLQSMGVENVVVDAASIEVSRRARRAKTDRVDLETLQEKLRRYHAGERVWKVVRVPDEQAEAGRHLHREAEGLKRERTRQVNRIKGLLHAQGVRVERIVVRGWEARVRGFRDFRGQPLAPDLQGQLQRTGERLALVEKQLHALEAEQERRLREAGAQPQGPLAMVRALRRLKSIGPVGSWVLVMEFFGWRKFANGRQVGRLAGLTGTPYRSGTLEREQGIGKDGNRRVRALVVELAWLWLRHQPDSALSQWYARRFAGCSKRPRRVGIVALARKLLVALWRYVDKGVLPEGAALKAAAG